MTQPASINGSRHGTGPDGRAGLGYGQKEPKFHISRQEPSSYPYPEGDDYEDEDISDIPIEIQDKLRKIINGYLVSDFLAMKGTDPFYYVAGNNKLSERVTGKSISPMPGLYKKRIQVGGGTPEPTASSPSSLQRLGSTIGYSHPHRSVGPDRDVTYEDIDDIEDIDELPMVRVRMVIKKMLDSER